MDQLLLSRRTVPTQNDILVPETLLKKRKSQEKAREDRAIATKEKRGTIITTCDE
jgi:large subunit ribosomal protein L7e